MKRECGAGGMLNLSEIRSGMVVSNNFPFWSLFKIEMSLDKDIIANYPL